MVRKYVFTGGLAPGRSTAIRRLEASGHRVYDDLCFDAFKACALTSSGGISASIASSEEFAGKWAQKWFDQKLDQYTTATDPCFFNCGIFDPLAIFSMAEKPIPRDLLDQAKNCQYLNPVFVFEEPLPQSRGDDWPSRFLSRTESRRFHGLVTALWKSQGYELCHVPPLPVEDQVAFILART